ncbi:hypothetical protein LCGC14_2966770 [marine sediment metagenome]|uniref:Uncharacterized protein n=1 Tax=marine sediment metagenome TaxID=412755 RepID=A0A0F8XXZ7_9ZZZZ
MNKPLYGYKQLVRRPDWKYEVRGFVHHPDGRGDSWGRYRVIGTYNTRLEALTAHPTVRVRGASYPYRTCPVNMAINRSRLHGVDTTPRTD